MTANWANHKIPCSQPFAELLIMNRILSDQSRMVSQENRRLASMHRLARSWGSWTSAPNHATLSIALTHRAEGHGVT